MTETELPANGAILVDPYKQLPIKRIRRYAFVQTTTGRKDAFAYRVVQGQRVFLTTEELTIYVPNRNTEPRPLRLELKPMSRLRPTAYVLRLNIRDPYEIAGVEYMGIRTAVAKLTIEVVIVDCRPVCYAVLTGDAS